MTFTALKARLSRLEMSQHRTRFDHLDREGLERELFVRLHRVASRSGGLDALLAEWDENPDPQLAAIVAKVRPYVLNVRDHYAEMEARFCTPH